MMDKVRKTADGGGTTAEAEQVDSVPCLVVVEDERIALLDNLRDAKSAHVARNLVPILADPRIIKDDLTRRPVLQHVEHVVDIRVELHAAILPSTIREYDDILWHCAP